LKLLSIQLREALKVAVLNGNRLGFFEKVVKKVLFKETYLSQYIRTTFDFKPYID